ncbi:hypothetical protein M422DRAFT_272157 [Sphaerobolus stellatus SS14]|uniref:Uncharacterized protein n=1 Tax=Sphaerobolus stellatus (strain SS14) TaxID=990650 RepID=A0A0C9TY32_SPHS4|nr:hypothetical protein M422DRAFT_272157 [Sphaerobolus stellatus SS14]
MLNNSSPRGLAAIHGSPIASLLKVILIWLAGCILAVLHHVYNSQLNNRPVQTLDRHHHTAKDVFFSQQGVNAVNPTLANLASAAMAASTAIAFFQCAWYLVRRRSFTVAGLNALWSAPGSLLSFFDGDFLRMAKSVVLVAVAIHLFPLVVTFVPGALTVHSAGLSNVTQCQVPTLNFGNNGLLFDLQDFQYIHPSALAVSIIGATVLGAQPLTPISPCGDNCTYSIQFNAPSFSCTDSLQNSSALPIARPDSAPNAYTGQSFDSTPQQTGIYSGWDFQLETVDYQNSPVGNVKNLTCVAYDSTYQVDYTFRGAGVPSAVPRVLSLGNQSLAQLGVTDPITPLAFDGTSPQTLEFNTTTNYFATLSALYSYISGDVTVHVTADSAGFSPVTLAAGIRQLLSTSTGATLTWVNDPAAVMESMLQNITLSLLVGTSTLSPAGTTTVPCTMFSSAQHWSYDAERLWLAYGLALLLSFLGNLLGIIAIWRNAFGASGGFADFLAATRNSNLSEDIVDPVEWKMGTLRLQYGRLRGSGGKYAFAPPENLFQEDDLAEETGTDDEKDMGGLGHAHTWSESVRVGKDVPLLK